MTMDGRWHRACICIGYKQEMGSRWRRGSCYCSDEEKGIAVDEDGYIYVSDVGNRCIQKFAPENGSAATATTC